MVWVVPMARAMFDRCGVVLGCAALTFTRFSSVWRMRRTPVMRHSIARNAALETKRKDGNDEAACRTPDSALGRCGPCRADTRTIQRLPPGVSIRERFVGIERISFRGRYACRLVLGSDQRGRPRRCVCQERRRRAGPLLLSGWRRMDWREPVHHDRRSICPHPVQPGGCPRPAADRHPVLFGFLADEMIGYWLWDLLLDGPKWLDLRHPGRRELHHRQPGGVPEQLGTERVCAERTQRASALLEALSR